MVQYAVLIYAADAATDAGELEVHDRHAQQLEASGALVAAFALEPGATATSLRGDGVTDGPFVDAKEVVAGFYILEAPDLDAALRIAGGNPVIAMGGGVEVRPIAGGFVRPPSGS
ncbi:YciI family protein [Dactylosporangium sp. NPDC049140]|jgi:hypothetical protein|uniref:YciI family protein n=1 Tax=Dactylosporangium sp. NPDC049140 TaxID=3155647 RepID=UPI0033D6EE71